MQRLTVQGLKVYMYTKTLQQAGVDTNKSPSKKQNMQRKKKRFPNLDKIQ